MLKKSLVIFTLLTSFLVSGLPTLAKPRIKPKPPQNNIIKTNQLDLSKIILNEKDLPKGFKLYNQEKKKDGYGFFWERKKEKSSELIIGHAGMLDTSAAEMKKQITPENVPIIKQSIMQIFDQIDFAQQLGKKTKIKVKTISSEELKVPADIGDVAVGKTLLLEVEGVPTRVDQVVFIRGNVMAMLIKIHGDNDPDVVPILGLLRAMDTRLKQSFQL